MRVTCFSATCWGARDTDPPLSTRGERVWFVLYTILSWAYRILVYVGIVLFIAGKFFFVGILFACWAAINMFVLAGVQGAEIPGVFTEAETPIASGHTQ